MTSLTADLATAQAEVTRLTNQVGSVTDPTSLQGLLVAANTDVTRLTSELAAAKAQVATLTSQLTSSRAEVTRLQVRLDAALGRAEEAEEDLEDTAAVAAAAERQQQQLQSQLTEAQQAEQAARATQYFLALTMPTGRGAANTPVVSYERDSRIPIVYPGEEMRQVSGGAPSISGFTAYSFASEDKTAYIYTNIASAGTREFWEEYGLSVASIASSDTNAIPTAAPLADVDPDPDNDVTATMTTVRGTYDGVSGTFTCTMTNCAAGVSDPNPATLQRRFTTDNTWDFVPSRHTAGVQMDHDTEFLYFGIWFEEPDNVADPHDFEFILGGNNPRPETTFTATEVLSGTYRFRGGAVGKYATRNQLGESDRVGTFTAQANLTAILGDDHPVEDQRDTLTGLISSFRDSGTGTALGDDWEVTLSRGDISTNEVSASTVSAKSVAKLSMPALGPLPCTARTTTLNSPKRNGEEIIPSAATRRRTWRVWWALSMPATTATQQIPTLSWPVPSAPRHASVASHLYFRV